MVGNTYGKSALVAPSGIVINRNIIPISYRKSGCPKFHIRIVRGIYFAAHFNKVRIPKGHEGSFQGPFRTVYPDLYGDIIGRSLELEPPVVIGSVGPAGSSGFIGCGIIGCIGGKSGTPIVQIEKLPGPIPEIVTEGIVHAQGEGSPVISVIIIINRDIIPISRNQTECIGGYKNVVISGTITAAGQFITGLIP